MRLARRHGGTGTRCVRTLVACLLLSLIAAPAALTGEWENVRERYDDKLRAHAKRIAEIEAREGGVPADREKRAEKITRDRITGIRASVKGGGKAKSLADTAEKASGDAWASVDLYREHSEHLDTVMNQWGAEGAERKKLRESLAALQKDVERANANLARTTEVAEAMGLRVPQSGVLEQVGRIEAEARDAADRFRARWQLDQAARERAREQREREAAERERSIR